MSTTTTTNRVGRKTRCVSQRKLRVINRQEAELDSETPWRPTTRGDCAGVPRPCPYVGCKYNLYLDVTKSGSLCYGFPDLEVDQMKQSCVLDVVDAEGAVTLERAGEVMNVTRERTRQVEAKAVVKFRRRLRMLGVGEL